MCKQRRGVLTGLLVLALFSAGLLFSQRTFAATGTNQELAFEGKIVLANGTNITNSNYNMEFKIYSGCTAASPGPSPNNAGCTLDWTEDYLVGSSDNGVTMTNGTFEENLGSVNPFGTSVNWNSTPLYLSLQVGNTSSCTVTITFTANCGGDGEMGPYIELTAVPYAFNAMELGGIASTGYGQLANAQSWTAINTFSPTGGGNAIALSGAPANVATSSVLQLGSPIALGNTATNGGTYIGLNEPSTGAGSAADFLNLQVNGISKLKVDNSGDITANGTLQVASATVTSGGITVTGNSTIAGTLSSLTGLTSSGTVTFSGLNSAGAVMTNASGVLSTGSIPLGTDTTGNYVANLGTLVGLTTTGNSGETSAPTLSVVYGAAADEAVVGTTTLICPAGSDNLSGGGTTIILGSGGTCAGITMTSTPSFSGLTLTGAETDSFSSSVSASEDTKTVTNTNTSTTASIVNGLNLTLVGTADSNSNDTLNALSLNATTATGTTFNGLNFGTNFTNLIDSANFVVAANGNVTNDGSYNGDSLTANGLTFTNGTGANTINGTSNQSLTLASQGSGQLLLSSASGTLGLGNATSTIQRIATGTTSIDLDDTGATTLELLNSGAGTSSLDLYDGGLEVGSTPTTVLTNGGALQNITTIGASGLVTLTGGVTDTGTMTNTGTLLVQGTGSLALLTASSANDNVQIGSATSDTTEVNLQLDSYATFADSSTCTTTSNQGALYYNTASNTVRACIDGSWQDLVSTQGLATLLFGVIPNSGTNPGDLVGASATTTAYTGGPCKVTYSSATSVNVASCLAYSGGREVSVPATNVPIGTVAANDYENICLNSSGVPVAMGTPSATDGAQKAANLTNTNATTLGQPTLCLATIKSTTANDVNLIYDIRTFTNTTKSYGTMASATQVLGGLVGGSTAGLVANTTSVTGTILGVLVAGTNTAGTAGTANVIYATDGPQWIKATGGGQGDYIDDTATAGYALGTSTTAEDAFDQAGLDEGGTYETSCSAATFGATDCQASVFTYLQIQ